MRAATEGAHLEEMALRHGTVGTIKGVTTGANPKLQHQPALFIHALRQRHGSSEACGLGNNDR